MSIYLDEGSTDQIFIINYQNCELFLSICPYYLDMLAAVVAVTHVIRFLDIH